MLEEILDFKKISGIKAEVLPVVVQEIESNAVIMLGYANLEALQYSLEHARAAFWSTKKNQLWVKGSTSGNYLKIKAVLINCENNSLLYRVELQGSGGCHIKDPQGNYRKSCFYRNLSIDSNHKTRIDVENKTDLN